MATVAQSWCRERRAGGPLPLTGRLGFDFQVQCQWGRGPPGPSGPRLAAAAAATTVVAPGQMIDDFLSIPDAVFLPLYRLVLKLVCPGGRPRPVSPRPPGPGPGPTRGTAAWQRNEKKSLDESATQASPPNLTFTLPVSRNSESESEISHGG